jgi:hypothetical protein
MRIFKTKAFIRFMRREAIKDDQLGAVERAEEGLVDADLGGGVIKQRIARAGEGKSGGYRAIVVLRRGERGFFVHGFAKNDQGNITKDEVKAFKKLASELLSYHDDHLRNVLKHGTLVEVKGR